MKETKGDRVLWDGTLYKVLQDHTSQGAWKPADVPSLWAKVLTSDDGTPKEWVQPDSTNSYKKGERTRMSEYFIKPIVKTLML